MSMQIIVSGTAPRATAGRNVRYIRGTEVPVYDPLFFYDFAEGVVGQPFGASFANLAGGVSGAILGARAVPTKTADGIRIDSPNGLMIDTGISTRREGFVLACVGRIRSKAAGSPVTYNMALLSATDSNTIPADPALGTTFNNFPGLGYSLNDNFQTALGFSTGLAPTAPANLNLLPAGILTQDTWFALALNIHGPTGRAKVHSLLTTLDRSDSQRGNTVIRDMFVTNQASRSGNLIVGMNPQGTPRASAGPMGDLVCAGGFNGDRSDSEVAAILQGMARLAVARGRTVAGLAA